MPSARTGWSFPLRIHLLVLVVGTLLPALVLAGVLIQRLVTDRRDSVQRQLLEAARAQATVLDAELSGTIRALRALAESDRLASGNLPGFRDEAERVQRTQPAWHNVILHSPSGGAVANVAPVDGAVPALEDTSLTRIMETKEPTIGALRGGSGVPWAIPVHMPVIREGRVAYILSAVITPDRLAELMRSQQTFPDEWVRGVVDENGVIVARTRDPERFVGQQGTPEFLKRFANANEAVYRDTTLEGQSIYGASARAPMSRWIAGIAVPTSVVDAAFRRSMLALSAFGLVLLVIGFAGAYEISRRISRDIAGAARSAEAIAQGMPAHLSHSPVFEVQQLSVALVRSADLLAARQRERDEQVARADAARQEAEAARVEAENADRAKDEFLAMLGHELRNPLAPVLTALELMRLRGEGVARREREIIERQVKHLVRLVDDLFDVSRVRRGRIQLQRRPFEIIQAVEKAVEISSPLVTNRGHQLTVDVSVKGLAVDGDETRLAQVFANLLTNAAKYSSGPGHIALRGSVESGMVVIRCEDNGAGIPPDLLPRVFDLFRQGRQSLDRQGGGLGLGLAVAKTLVELHGGSIEAASSGAGLGSTFIVRLPHVAAAVAESATPEMLESVPVAAGRILVVDDNIDAAEMLAETLRHGGFEVATAFDGVEALKTMERFQADVAILDIGLPSIDGLELARRLRGAGRTRHVRLIALTGYGQEGDVARSRAAGFDKHLVKPVAAATLFEAVSSRNVA